MKRASGGLLAGKKSAEGIDKKGKTRAMGSRSDSGATVKETTGPGKKYAKGGSVFRSSANGIESKGKTKTKVC